MARKVYIHKNTPKKIPSYPLLLWSLGLMYLPMKNTYDAIALFSGGLDSILAVKVLEEQGLKVKCLNFVTPFFGKPDMLSTWRKLYNVDVSAVDIGEDFVQLLRTRPEHGFGKLLNPCVDCKILLMRKAHELMQFYGASCVVSGEVLGQRPMSQRRDTLNVIRRDSGLKEILLRPLSAKLLDPSAAELSGLVDRDKLHNISGRGRKKQLELAAYYGITEIPTPAGGCMLAEQENASRYWMVLTRVAEPTAEDFTLAHTGRQYWSEEGRGERWLCIGRNAGSNARLQELVQPEDYVFRLRDFAGPLAVGRHMGGWDEATLQDAAAFVASYSPKAVQSGGEVVVMLRQGEQGNKERAIQLLPKRESTLQWQEPLWADAKEAKREEIRQKEASQSL